MRFLHLADIHLGKRVNGYSMEEEQKNILEQVICYVQSKKDTEEQIDGVLLAGDIYDKSIPPEFAVALFDQFLTDLASLGTEVFLISGNHDSAERLNYASRLLEKNHVHVVCKYNGKIACTTVHDAYGEICVYMLPFIRPVDVRMALDCDVRTYQEALEEVMKHEKLDTSKRNILLAHQNINGAIKSDSEDVFIGGLDGISAELFQDFDYVALGHLHRNQRVTSDCIRYAGSPVKYSVSEWNHKKAMNEIVLNEKGKCMVYKIPFTPIHDVRIVTGTFDAIMHNQVDAGMDTNDYVSVVLKDEMEIMNAIRKLRDRYPNLMGMKYDNTRTQNQNNVQEIPMDREKSPMEYIDAFFQMAQNKEMSDEQRELIEKIVHDLWEEDA